MKIKDILIVTIIIISSIVLYLLFSNPDVMAFFDSIGVSMYNFVVANPSTAYLSAFLISTFGNFTVFLPIPYAIAVVLLGTQPFINPGILAIICGLGSGIGELSAYFIGVGGRKFVEEKYARTLDSMKALIERYGFFAIVLFAATPLPDDMLLIPLGVLKYSLSKTILASIIGKIALCAILAYGGRISSPLIEFIFVGSGAIGTVVGVVGTILLVYILFRIDWNQILNPPTYNNIKENNTSSSNEENYNESK